MIRTFQFIILFTLISASSWANDPVIVSDQRQTQVQQYMREFVSGDMKSFPNIYEALWHGLMVLPDDVFDAITDRKRPMVFTIGYTTTIARFARSSEFMKEDGDPPTFSDGVFITTLADELNYKGSLEAIQGVIFHEIAHRYLENLHRKEPECELERDANRIIKEWGFEKEFSAAKELFGAKKKGDSNCYDQLIPETIN